MEPSGWRRENWCSEGGMCSSMVKCSSKTASHVEGLWISPWPVPRSGLKANDSKRLFLSLKYSDLEY